MTVRINASSAGLTETVDTSGILEFQTANTSALVIDASQNANFTSTGAIVVPVGTTATRPSAANGMIRYNSNSAAFEVYANNSWATANVTPAPTVVSAPVISGSPVVGNNLTCTTGTWNNNPTGYFYQWLANSVAISANATSNVFTLTSTQNNTNITCNVTAFNAAGNSIPSTSNSLGPVTTGYFLNRSLRFRSSASAFLNRTPASAGNRRTWTWSGWVKRGTVSSQSDLFAAYIGSGTTDNQYFLLYFDSAATLRTGGYSTGYLTSTAVYRDPSAWYHIVCAVDTTQATANNRIRLYVNGAEVTSFSTRNNPTQNAELGINQAAQHQIGQNGGFGSYFDGYLTEVNFIDGQALTPSSFGENNTNTGVWQPIAYTGTYGTNGFYLPFTNITSTSTLGNDFSGNGNNWTTNNFSLTAGVTYDSMTDVPTLTNATTANYATLNPLNSTATISNGNLNSSAGASFIDALATIECTAGVGKWYFEGTLLTLSGTNAWIGVTRSSNSGLNHDAVDSYRTVYQANGIVYREGTGIGNTTTGTTFTTNDVIGVALDSVTGSISFYKNNTLINTTTNSVYSSNSFFFYTGQNSSSWAVNFGQRPFAYTPPSGFVSLNTFNLPTPTIGATASTQANKYMDATLYTGTGSSLSVTNAGGFRPDLVWIKSRSNTYNNELYDSVRGVQKRLISNLTNAESTSANGLTAFNSNGFTQGGETETGANGATYVGWQWQAGAGTTSNNTSGSITTTVSVNASVGFSIIRYAGNNSSGSATLGHGLGVAPVFMIFKNRDQTGDWGVYHQNMASSNPQNGYLQLNLNNAYGTNSTIWNNTAPTSSVVSIGSYFNGTNINYIGYVWAEVAGFSRFGSYTGNGSTDGPFVFTGFRPKFVIAKRTDNSTTGDWIISDTSRSPFNVANANLFSNLTNGDSSGLMAVDFLSNGFKVRSSIWGNQSGSPYIYIAFAENPFKYALAR